MGFFSFLYDRKKLGNQKKSKNKRKQVAKHKGPGTFEIEVVGESNYQEALEDICGGKSENEVNKIVEAKLIPEDNNQYDENAVRVKIKGRTVGYLSRKNAKEYRKVMANAGYPSIAATCKAKIRGGWDRGSGNEGDFGVWLDLNTT